MPEVDFLKTENTSYSVLRTMTIVLILSQYERQSYTSADSDQTATDVIGCDLWHVLNVMINALRSS